MKKIIPIILVLVMAFAFSITTLAEDEENIVVLPPVDAGLDEETWTRENLDLVLVEPPDGVEGNIWSPDPDWFEETWADTYEEDLLDIVEGYKNSDAYDEKVVFNAIQFIAVTTVFDPSIGEFGTGVTGVGGKITITNYFLGNDTLKAILQWFEDETYILITNFDYDPVTGTLTFDVDDLGMWSMFLALIERGIPPAQAAKILSARSPQTADNSINGGIILLLTLSAAAGTVVISKKVRNHN